MAEEKPNPEVKVPETESNANDTISAVSDLWLIKKQIEAEIRPTLREEYEKLFKIWKTTELLDLEKKNQIIINDGLEKLFQKYKDSQQPPTDAELQQLLDQEYKTFNLKVDWVTEEDEPKHETFVIRELPASVERRFYRTFKERLLSKASVIQSFTQANIDVPFETKLRHTVDLFEDSFDILADAVTMCLNPFNKKSSPVTREWVQNNISMDRQWGIIQAQIEVNRLKDFFSKISQSGQSMTTILNGVNIQQLQQLVR